MLLPHYSSILIEPLCKSNFDIKFYGKHISTTRTVEEEI